MKNITEVILDNNPLTLGFLISEMLMLNIPFAMKHMNGEVEMHASPSFEQSQELDSIIMTLNNTDVNVG